MKNMRFLTFFVIPALLFIPLYSFSAIYKNIDSDSRVTYSNIRTKGSTRVDAVSPRWELLDDNKYTEDRLYIDLESILRNGAFIKLWVMKITDAGEDKKYLEFNCGKRSYKILAVQSYLPQVKPNANLVEYIVPESDIEKAYIASCKD